MNYDDKQLLSNYYLDRTIQAIKELNVAFQLVQIFVLSMDGVFFIDDKLDQEK